MSGASFVSTETAYHPNVVCLPAVNVCRRAAFAHGSVFAKEAHMKRRKRSSAVSVVVISILLLAAAGLIGTGVYLIFFKNRDAFERQKEEEEIADQYIQDLILMEEDPEAYERLVEERMRIQAQRVSDEARRDSVSNTDQTDADWQDYSGAYQDENYYTRDDITYTPDYAQGTLDCRLEVPTAGINRGVYTGTWDEINYNLDIWMVTTARPDYVLGETRYCIYGHNHTVQNLSFNQLQKVQVGELFYLTGKSGRYTYEITNVFAVSREDATANYVDNEAIGSDKCYLITCGRDDGERNYRYLDLIVEGTLKEHLTIREYAEQLKKMK